MNIELRLKGKKSRTNNKHFLKTQNADEKLMRTHELGVGNIFHQRFFNVLNDFTKWHILFNERKNKALNNFLTF